MLPNIEATVTAAILAGIFTTVGVILKNYFDDTKRRKDLQYEILKSAYESYLALSRVGVDNKSNSNSPKDLNTIIQEAVNNIFIENMKVLKEIEIIFEQVEIVLDDETKSELKRDIDNCKNEHGILCSDITFRDFDDHNPVDPRSYMIFDDHVSEIKEKLRSAIEQELRKKLF